MPILIRSGFDMALMNVRSGIPLALLPLLFGCTSCNGKDGLNSTEPSPIVQITVSPDSANVSIGGTITFGTSAGHQDGGTSVPLVAWSATGGTISAGGLYTAGSTAGSFRVIATQQGGTLADTAAVTVTALATGNSYSTSFPLTETAISEGGRWINGGTVGLDWTNVSTTPGLAIGHQVGADYTDATALLTGAWGPDRRVSATVYAVNQNDPCYQEVELRLRSAMAAHVNTGYEVSFKSSQSSEAYVIIVRWNGALGDFTYLANLHGAQYGVKNGDVVSASIVGTVITAYKNGIQMAQGTDATYPADAPGMGFNLYSSPPGCAGSNGDYGFSTYTASDTP